MEDYELKNYVQSRGDETRALESQSESGGWCPVRCKLKQ